MKRILYIEGDDEERESVSRALRNDGFEVFAVVSAHDALDSLSDGAEPPHLLIANVSTPQQRGVEELPNLRFKCRQARLVLITDPSHVGHYNDTLHDSEILYAAKPVTHEKLLAVLQSALSDSLEHHGP